MNVLDQLKTINDNMPKVHDSGKTPVDAELSEISENPVQNKVVTNELKKKVTKEDGKGLSTNDFDDTLKEKVENDTFAGVIELNEEFNPDKTPVFLATFGSKGTYKVIERFGDEIVKSTLYVCRKYGTNADYFDYEEYLYRKGEVYFNCFGDESGYENTWDKISVSQADIERIKLNPAIKIKSGAGYLNWQELIEMDVPAGMSIIYSVDGNESTYEYGFVIKSYGDYEQLVVMCPNGEIREIHRDYDTGEWLEWTSPYVTPAKLNNAIGDIETSLENIIKKYGLGGDDV